MEVTLSCVPLSIGQIFSELCGLSGIFGTTNIEKMPSVVFDRT